MKNENFGNNGSLVSAPNSSGCDLLWSRVVVLSLKPDTHAEALAYGNNSF